MTYELATMALQGEHLSSSRAASSTAHYITDEIRRINEYFLQSYTFGYKLHNVLDGLDALQQECAVQGWDGYSAVSISSAIFELAKSIISVFPSHMPFPEISAEPDGNISFEWYRSPFRVLSVSVTPDSDMHYAALIGCSTKAYGTEPFKGSFPEAILQIVQRIFAL
jgi:hypothetical protein